MPCEARGRAQTTLGEEGQSGFRKRTTCELAVVGKVEIYWAGDLRIRMLLILKKEKRRKKACAGACKVGRMARRRTSGAAADSGHLEFRR